MFFFPLAACKECVFEGSRQKGDDLNESCQLTPGKFRQTVTGVEGGGPKLGGEEKAEGEGMDDSSTAGLNYDELAVVYDDDAIRPSYLFLYDMSQWGTSCSSVIVDGRSICFSEIWIGGGMRASAGGTVRAQPAISECGRRSKNPGLRSPTYREHSLLLKGCDSPGELIPILVESSTTRQGRENINHSPCHGVKTGLVEVEWCPIDVQTCEWAPRAGTQLLRSWVLRGVLEIVNDVRGVEVDLQFLQLGAVNGYRKEAGDSCGAGVFETRVSKEERL